MLAQLELDDGEIVQRHRQIGWIERDSCACNRSYLLSIGKRLLEFLGKDMGLELFVGAREIFFG